MLARLFYPFFFPGIFITGIGVLLATKPALAEGLEPYLAILFVCVVALGLFVGWRFKRSRLILAILLLALAASASLLSSTQSLTTDLLGLNLPINLCLILLLPEKGLASVFSALYGSIVLAQGLGGLWIAARHPELFDKLLYQTLPYVPLLPIQPSVMHIVTLLASLILAVLVFRSRPQPLEAAFFWTIPLVTLPYYFNSDTHVILVFYGLAEVNLLAGLLETSHSMSYRDELTGIPGRRALNEALGRLGRNYCLAMLDIDHFKKFNDKHSHDVGDQVLKMVAAQLASVGGNGQTYRYGGEEFTVLFPGKNLNEALPQLETLREKIATTAFIPRGLNRPRKKPKKATQTDRTRKALTVTISIGAAVPTKENRSTELVLQAADKALYRAKQQGRNRVCS